MRVESPGHLRYTGPVTGERGQDTPPEVVAGVLGNLEVLVDGAPVPVGHTRQKAVLAVLLAEVGRVVPPDRLVERVWGERPPVRARSVLRTYLSNLRRALEPTGIAITWQDTGYRLTAAADSVDLHRFRRLLAQARDAGDPRQALDLADEALALWRGEPLAELDTSWARSAREHLSREWTVASADRVDWALACGRHGDLLPELSTRAGEHPLDERLAGQLMLALYRSGRQADALECYRRVRHELAEELGADPGPALQQLHQRVLAADPALSVPAAEVVRRSVVPRQLPAPPAPFVGRGNELGQLDGALDTSGEAATVVISALAGAGGIGKTWLALHWAHRHVDRFPDGQLFVDLHGFSPDSEPMNPAVAVRGFLDALGVDPGRIPADPHAQAALFRSLVAGKRMLVVLDNAADTAHVTALLPGSRSCTVLVTSRNRLAGLVTGRGARHLVLDVLSADEARTLLHDRLGADRVGAEPAVDELVALCGGFPLALGIVAGHARAQPRLSLTALVDELRELGLGALDDDDPATSLPAVLSWSHRALSPQRAEAFALLGIAPGPDIGLPAAASLLGLPPAAAHKTLQGLVDASLVDRTSSGRYAMHDLIRAYAVTTAQALSAEARQTALDRVVDFYLHTTHTADRLLAPHRQPVGLDQPLPGVQPHPLPDTQETLAWLTAEHANLLAALHTAMSRRRYRTAWQLAWVVSTFHDWQGHRHDNLAVWQVALEAAGHLPEPGTVIRTLRRLGQARAELGQHEEATGHLRHALVLADEHQELTELAHTHRQLAWASELQGDDQQALDHTRQALELHRALDQPVWEAHALNNAGWYAARLGDHDTAREHCLAALELGRRHDDSLLELGALHSLGWIDHQTGHHDRAIDHYRQSLVVRRATGNRTEIALALDSLGHPHLALGQHDQTRAVWREALDLYRQQGRDDDAERVQRQLDDLDRATVAGHGDGGA